MEPWNHQLADTKWSLNQSKNLMSRNHDNVWYRSVTRNPAKILASIKITWPIDWSRSLIRFCQGFADWHNRELGSIVSSNQRLNLRQWFWWPSLVHETCKKYTVFLARIRFRGFMPLHTTTFLQDPSSKIGKEVYCEFYPHLNFQNV